MSPPRSNRRIVRLKLTDANGFSKVVLIEQELFSIGGAASSGLVLPDGEAHAVAPRHAVIAREGEEYVLKVESGASGTRVNGRPVRRMVLKHGDQISLGTSPMKVQFLVEGTRAADLGPSRMRQIMEALRSLHEGADPRETSARAVAGVMGLIVPGWTVLALEEGGRLDVAAAGDSSGVLPLEPSKAARDVYASGRSLFKPDHLCAPVAGARRRLGVIEVGPRQDADYTAADLELLEGLAAHLGAALLNARRLSGEPETSATAHAG